MKTSLPPSTTSTRRSGWALRLLYACLIGIIFAVSLWIYHLSGPSVSPDATVTPVPPTPATNAERLVKPTLISPENPTQLDEGALVYWGVCMACHGDRGQGLTDEWRSVFGEDSNCWASKCHASNHPPQGFVIPRTPGAVPAVVGVGALTRFDTAQELYEYILVSMPWWNPESLTSEKAWGLTAYILKLNGTLPQGIELDVNDASAISVHHLVASSQNDEIVEFTLAAVLVLIAVVMVMRAVVKRKTAAEPSTGMASGRARGSSRRPSFLHHLHPPTIPAQQARWRYTLGMGGLAVFLFLVLLVTGILEMFYYVPQADQAAVSIQTIAHLVPYGGLIRNLHYWGAQALVVVVIIHMLRVVLTGAYKPPRRFNYMLGVFLLVLTLFLDFTGYILRWDEGVSWALVVGTNLIKAIPRIGPSLYEFVIGGVQPGSATLLRFYSWHVFGLAFVMIFVGIWHIFRIRRDGGIAVPPPALRQSEARISRFELVRRETLTMVIAGIALLLVSIFWPAPIAPPLSNAAVDLSSARAPWFFLWVQQLLKWGDAFLLGIIVPLAVLAIVFLIPYICPKAPDAELGRWFPREGRVAQFLIIILVLLMLSLTVWAILPASWLE